MYKINLIVLSVVFVTCFTILIHQTFAQEDQTTTTTAPVDVPLVSDPTTAAVSAIGLAGAGTMLF